MEGAVGIRIAQAQSTASNGLRSRASSVDSTVSQSSLPRRLATNDPLQQPRPDAARKSAEAGCDDSDIIAGQLPVHQSPHIYAAGQPPLSRSSGMRMKTDFRKPYGDVNSQSSGGASSKAGQSLGAGGMPSLALPGAAGGTHTGRGLPHSGSTGDLAGSAGFIPPPARSRGGSRASLPGESRRRLQGPTTAPGPAALASSGAPSARQPAGIHVPAALHGTRHRAGSAVGSRRGAGVGSRRSAPRVHPVQLQQPQPQLAGPMPWPARGRQGTGPVDGHGMVRGMVAGMGMSGPESRVRAAVPGDLQPHGNARGGGVVAPPSLPGHRGVTAPVGGDGDVPAGGRPPLRPASSSMFFSDDEEDSGAEGAVAGAGHGVRQWADPPAAAGVAIPGHRARPKQDTHRDQAESGGTGSDMDGSASSPSPGPSSSGDDEDDEEDRQLSAPLEDAMRAMDVMLGMGGGPAPGDGEQGVGAASGRRRSSLGSRRRRSRGASAHTASKSPRSALRERLSGAGNSDAGVEAAVHRASAHGHVASPARGRPVALSGGGSPSTPGSGHDSMHGSVSSPALGDMGSNGIGIGMGGPPSSGGRDDATGSVTSYNATGGRLRSYDGDGSASRDGSPGRLYAPSALGRGAASGTQGAHTRRRSGSRLTPAELRQRRRQWKRPEAGRQGSGGAGTGDGSSSIGGKLEAGSVAGTAHSGPRQHRSYSQHTQGGRQRLVSEQSQGTLNSRAGAGGASPGLLAPDSASTNGHGPGLREDGDRMSTASGSASAAGRGQEGSQSMGGRQGRARKGPLSSLKGLQGGTRHSPRLPQALLTPAGSVTRGQGSSGPGSATGSCSLSVPGAPGDGEGDGEGDTGASASKPGSKGGHDRGISGVSGGLQAGSSRGGTAQGSPRSGSARSGTASASADTEGGGPGSSVAAKRQATAPQAPGSSPVGGSSWKLGSAKNSPARRARGRSEQDLFGASPSTRAGASDAGAGAGAGSRGVTSNPGGPHTGGTGSGGAGGETWYPFAPASLARARSLWDLREFETEAESELRFRVFQVAPSGEGRDAVPPSDPSHPVAVLRKMAEAEGQRIARDVHRRLTASEQAAASGAKAPAAASAGPARGGTAWDPVRVKALSEIAELEAQGEPVPPEIKEAAGRGSNQGGASAGAQAEGQKKAPVKRRRGRFAQKAAAREAAGLSLSTAVQKKGGPESAGRAVPRAGAGVGQAAGRVRAPLGVLGCMYSPWDAAGSEARAMLWSLAQWLCLQQPWKTPFPLIDGAPGASTVPRPVHDRDPWRWNAGNSAGGVDGAARRLHSAPASGAEDADTVLLFGAGNSGAAGQGASRAGGVAGGGTADAAGGAVGTSSGEQRILRPSDDDEQPRQQQQQVQRGAEQWRSGKLPVPGAILLPALQMAEAELTKALAQSEAVSLGQLLRPLMREELKFTVKEVVELLPGTPAAVCQGAGPFADEAVQVCEQLQAQCVRGGRPRWPPGPAADDRAAERRLALRCRMLSWCTYDDLDVPAVCRKDRGFPFRVAAGELRGVRSTASSLSKIARAESACMAIMRHLRQSMRATEDSAEIGAGSPGGRGPQSGADADAFLPCLIYLVCRCLGLQRGVKVLSREQVRELQQEVRVMGRRQSHTLQGPRPGGTGEQQEPQLPSLPPQAPGDVPQQVVEGAGAARSRASSTGQGPPSRSGASGSSPRIRGRRSPSVTAQDSPADSSMRELSVFRAPGEMGELRKEKGSPAVDILKQQWGTQHRPESSDSLFSGSSSPGGAPGDGEGNPEDTTGSGRRRSTILGPERGLDSRAGPVLAIWCELSHMLRFAGSGGPVGTVGPCVSPRQGYALGQLANALHFVVQGAQGTSFGVDDGEFARRCWASLLAGPRRASRQMSPQVARAVLRGGGQAQRTTNQVSPSEEGGVGAAGGPAQAIPMPQRQQLGAGIGQALETMPEASWEATPPRQLGRRGSSGVDLGTSQSDSDGSPLVRGR